MTRTELTRLLDGAGLHWDTYSHNGDMNAGVFVDGRDVRTTAQDKLLRGLFKTLPYPVIDEDGRGGVLFAVKA